MDNHEMVIQSIEKRESHKKINAFFMPWIKHYFARVDTSVTVTTMPAQSGIQETELLEYIEQLQSRRANKTNLQFLTFDKDLEYWETRIPMKYQLNGWTHHRDDVFDGLLKHGTPGAHAAWFDMTGGLSNKNLEGIKECVRQLFDPGSLLFVTFQVHAIRCLFGNVTQQTYESTANTVAGNTIHTARLLEQYVKLNAGKCLRRIMPTYTYKRKGAPTTFGLFGYIVV
jgi:hypothetical protein